MKVFVIEDGFVAVAERAPEGVRLSIPDLSGAHCVVEYPDDLDYAAKKLYDRWVSEHSELLAFPLVPVGLAETQRLLGMSMAVPTTVEAE